ncbi:sensor histidine kinase [marine gamma proteobacterium HTCC2143]|uniref:histidine kinase n=1 Tax=marine gamma proteobacterium HTCC2143 TaxID=247633 RepID=A0YB48_9GAMM|nr:sensor histidine kinase [marine gamma proteobacterium HTCC2143]
MKSIRVFLVIVLLSIICLVNFLAALHGYRSSMAAAEIILDEQITDSANLLAGILANDIVIPKDVFPDSVYYQHWQGGILQHKSANAPDTLLSSIEPGFHQANFEGVRWKTLVHPLANKDSQIIIAHRADTYSNLSEKIVLKSIFPIIWVLPFLGVLIWLVVYFGLHPLHRLASVLRRKKSEDLKSIENSGYPGELTEVVISINNLLERLDGAFDRERRFSADAAHELRTPLAALKVGLHNLIEESGPKSDNLQELEKGVDRMGHSIEQILAFHRLSPDRFLASPEVVDIKKIAQQTIVDLYSACERKNLNIAIEGTTVLVEGDRFALATLLKNLVDNAIKYTPVNGTIVIAIAAMGSVATIAVEDSGSGIKEADLQRVFDRFYRVGSATLQADIVGSGLGLSIVDHIVQLHRGSIEMGVSNILGGLKIEITLPLTQQPVALLDKS